jgi:hypothetical protein
MIKTMFQVLIVVFAKTVGKTDYKSHVFVYFFAFIIYLLINLKVKAFNYGVLWVWQVTSIFCVIWLEFLIILDTMTTEHFVYVILLFVGWFLFAMAAFVVIKKLFTNPLMMQSNPHLNRLYEFNFRFWTTRAQFIE